jgi:hypothetical protein
MPAFQAAPIAFREHRRLRAEGGEGGLERRVEVATSAAN